MMQSNSVIVELLFSWVERRDTFEVMNRTVKKQFWLTKEEDELLKQKAQQCCMPEASLLRMLIQDLVPKESPPQEFYEAMREVYRFGSNLSQLAAAARNTGFINVDILDEEVRQWQKFELEIEQRFLVPERKEEDGSQ